MAKIETIQGKLQGNERGYAFLIPSDGRDDDFFVPHSDLKGAMHGDTVLCETVTEEQGKRTVARVLKVLERGVKELVGTYFNHRAGGYVVPDDRKYFDDVFVPSGKGAAARGGDKVVVKILSYPKNKNPEGIVTRVLGRQFDKKAELKAIEITYNLPEAFPADVIESVGSMRGVTEKDLAGRRDFRGELTFTIDGDDARDFDDAVSLEVLGGGACRRGVHIADVSHYVRPQTPVDREAFERATSVYFPESVIPMLPEKLCNDLCSLKEGENRLTLSCIMTVDSNGNVTDKEIVPSVIKSRARMTYSEVQKILDGDENTARRFSFLTDTLKNMSDLADVLHARRDQNGSIDLDVKESAIYVDKGGNIVVEAAHGDKAHNIIEEFMIAANVAVAEYMFYLDKPFIYRVHDKPAPEKTDAFYAFLKGLGIPFKRRKDEIFSKDFQTILKKAENTPAFTVINRVMLRSMQKAVYSPVCLGHFGLSEKHYCHFTSPIRRYPDLVVHRVIKDFLSGADVEEKYGAFVATAAKQSSEKERNAIEAERAVDDFYKILYIGGYVGETFDGVVSGVTAFGVFVELDNGVEGLVRIDTLGKRRYVYDKENYTLSDGKNSYTLGQRVKITVAGVNVTERKAEFIMAEPESKSKRGGKDKSGKTETGFGRAGGAKNKAPTGAGKTQKSKARAGEKKAKSVKDVKVKRTAAKKSDKNPYDKKTKGASAKNNG